MPVTTAPSAEPAPRFRRWSATAPRCAPANGKSSPASSKPRRWPTRPAHPDAVEPVIAAAGLVSVFQVNLIGRDSDTEPPGQRAERALDLLEHGLGDYAVSPPHHLPRRAEMPDLRASRPHRDPPVGPADRRILAPGADQCRLLSVIRSRARRAAGSTMSGPMAAVPGQGARGGSSLVLGSMPRPRLLPLSAGSREPQDYAQVPAWLGFALSRGGGGLTDRPSAGSRPRARRSSRGTRPPLSRR